jgi:hypothetical protein
MKLGRPNWAQITRSLPINQWALRSLGSWGNDWQMLRLLQRMVCRLSKSAHSSQTFSTRVLHKLDGWIQCGPLSGYYPRNTPERFTVPSTLILPASSKPHLDSSIEFYTRLDEQLQQSSSPRMSRKQPKLYCTFSMRRKRTGF